MKKHIFMFFLLACPLWANAENKIQMVTYFPVPYVAYSKVNVNKQMDVGLTNVCAMNLGCNESGSAGLKPLQVTTANLNRGQLDLDTGAAALSTSVALGSGAGIAEFNFPQDLRIGTLNNGYSIETEQMTLDVLKLFPDRIKNDFPSCAATGAAGAPMVSWQQVQLKGKKETYLMCGNPFDTEPEPEPELDCSDNSYKESHKSECCPMTSHSDTVCWRKEVVSRWQSTSFSMASAFGSDWLTQTCQKKCWGYGYNDGCSKNGDVFEGVFTSNPKIVIVGSGNYNLALRDCTNGDATVCTGPLDKKYYCNSGNKDLVLVGFTGVAANGQGLSCPQDGSGQSPQWKGGQQSYICTVTETTQRNGW